MLAPIVLPKHDSIFTFDVETFHPSTLHGHSISTVRQYLLRQHFRYAMINSVHETIVILAESFCEFDGIIYHQHTGCATGVACGSDVAHIDSLQASSTG